MCLLCTSDFLLIALIIHLHNSARVNSEIVVITGLFLNCAIKLSVMCYNYGLDLFKSDLKLIIRSKRLKNYLLCVQVSSLVFLAI